MVFMDRKQRQTNLWTVNICVTGEQEELLPEQSPQHWRLLRLAGRWNADVHHPLFLLTAIGLRFLKAWNNFFFYSQKTKAVFIHK
jgi:hypothetical protein